MLRFDRRLLFNFNWGIMSTVLIIAALGLINLYSATYDPAGLSGYFIRQLQFYGFGLILILLLISFDYRLLIHLNYPIYLMSLLLLCYALLTDRTVAHTQRWIDLGFFNLQPSEPAKLALVINLAHYYCQKDTGRGFTTRDLIIPVILTALPFLLILKQPDLGTALLLGIIFVSMTLLVKVRKKTLLLLSSIVLTLIPLYWHYIMPDYQKQRVLTLLAPGNDPRGAGYHIIQSKIAIGSGLIFGKGYLQGTQSHLNFLPERHTDFAFSVWAEEWGFLGSLAFLACYFFMILMALKIAGSARDKFGLLLVYGIAALLFWQAAVNLGMILGILPVVGMPLPFFSYGGSSLITSLIGIGLILNVGMRRFMVTGGRS